MSTFKDNVVDNTSTKKFRYLLYRPSVTVLWKVTLFYGRRIENIKQNFLR